MPFLESKTGFRLRIREMTMTQSRRDFLCGTAAFAALGGTALGRVASPFDSDRSSLAAKIVGLFEPLPGIKAIKIWAPETDDEEEFLATLNPQLRLFCGSSFKAFVLCEALRQIDSPEVAAKLAAKQLELDSNVWSLSSSVFNPPDLSGLVSERTTLEAMISHSDNTATDMALKLVGSDNVRNFIAKIGLKNSFIPDSTRIFFGYIFGAPNYRTITWDEILSIVAANPPLAHPVINDVETMVSTPDDFVSFYSRALQGRFFMHPQTLAVFRQILTTADAIARVIPLGVSAFMKGGSIDAEPSHALCLAGGMFFAGRWAYFTTMINWEKNVETDPQTVGAFAAATKEAFELLVSKLSR